jgi:hypothetical protein
MAKKKKKTRPAIPPKMRFEVFKRDSFTCQYCGQSAPDVVLEADHIQPVSKGGSTDLMNLVTSCFECNRGKGARRLDDKSVVEKTKRQAIENQQRLEQIKMMAEWQSGMQDAKEAQFEIYRKAFWEPIWRHDEEIDEDRHRYTFGNYGMREAKRNIRRFGLKECLVSISIAHDYYLRIDGDDGFYTSRSIDEAMDKVGGICFKRNKEMEESE